VTNLVFMLPFDANPSKPWADALVRRLELTPTRVDDWDSQMGFRLFGSTGAIRLFRRTDQRESDYPAYALFGTAVSLGDRELVAQMFDDCVDAVRAIAERIDRERLIDPEQSQRLSREREF